MRYDVRKYLSHYPNVRGMIEDIPEQLWDVFLPESEGDLPDMEANVMAFKKRSNEREQAMALQKLCGLEFRPNEELNVTEAKVRIQGLKYRKIYEEHREKDEE